MTHRLLDALGLAEHPRIVLDAAEGQTPERDGVLVSMNPATARPIAGVRADAAEDCERLMAQAVEAFDRWRRVPAPVRGQVVRAIADELREHRDALGELIALEVGKIRPEGIGEVQETIDIADLAVGLSRQLYGLTMPSERPDHRIIEQWLPLGVVGIITGFNFPNAVWGWNAMLAAVCGDVSVWKPSPLAPLTAVATDAICERVCERMGQPGVFRLLVGADDVVGEALVNDRRVPLVSVTGSCATGRKIAQKVAARLGRYLLELGGNNAIIVEADADRELAARNVFFGAVGTAGQRCTTTRRLIVHESIAEDFVGRLVELYRTIRLGDPLEESTLVGPLIGERAVEGFERAIALAKEQGGEVLVGGTRADVPGLDGHFVNPAIVRAPATGALPIALAETFAPILYVFTYDALDEAIAMHNAVDQGLSSAIFTSSVRSAERFYAPSGTGSDCGLAYVNLGTSGAEIGGAFGGEKDTGGGREAGSDSWKAYMRRQTVTTNFAGEFRLAQGIQFGEG